jgi:hypothetical protein
MPADATNVFGDQTSDVSASVLSAEGFRHLRVVTGALHENRIQGGTRK